MARTLSVEIVGTGQLSPSDRALWLAWREADPQLASPFLHPDFARIAGEVAPGAAIAVLKRDGETVGFLPHQRRGQGLQPLGAPLNDYHGLIAAPGLDLDLEALPNLLGARQATVTGWIGAAAPSSTLTQSLTLQADLGAGWDAWYDARRAAYGKFFKDKDRARRSMERDHGLVRVEVSTGDLSHFDRLVELKRDQYRRSRRHDIFACGWTVELLRRLLTETGELRAHLAVLYAGGKAMAYELSLATGGQYHFWLPAYELEAARYSPGMLLSMDTMRERARQGVAEFDFGFEGEAYKKYFCDKSRIVSEGVVLRPGLVRRLADQAARAGGLATSIRRRWASIDACETTAVGRARALSSAAVAMAGRSRPVPISSAFMLAALCL